MATPTKTDYEQLLGILEEFDLDVVQAALDSITFGEVNQLSVNEVDDPGPEIYPGDDESVVEYSDLALERIIPDEVNFLPVHFLEEGAVLQRAVARVIRSSGSGRGTGSMVSPSLLLTNNHVIPSKEFAKTVRAQFNYQLDYDGNPQTADVYSFNPDDFFYTNAALDFTVVRVNRKWRHSFSIPPTITSNTLPDDEFNDMEYTPNPLGNSPVDLGMRIPNRLTPIPPISYPWITFYNAGDRWGWLKLPRHMTYAVDERVNIIQHPRGRRKEVALQDNKITNIYQTRVRYRTDTEPGSSGSPVFTNDWDLLALHHAAGERDAATGTWKSNQGIRIDKIVANLRNNLGGTSAGQAILTELGI